MNVSTLLQEVISYSLVSCPGHILSTPVAVLAALTTASGAMSHVSGSPTGSTETMERSDWSLALLSKSPGQLTRRSV